ncbi:MAG TPA: hypothetical protein VK846_15220 [Candidatus Limnocylindria bacterium]|nr:hypothetical protein [Candidatus Limnocylindria bacterium]
MKRIFVVTTLALVMGESNVLFAQKSAEAAVESPAAGGSASVAANGQSTTARGSRKNTTPSGLSGFGAGGGSYGVSSSRGDSIPPVMIRFSPSDAKASTTLEEDLFVMARVIGRTLERAETDKVKYKLGVPMLLTGSGRSVRPMYLEGMGPLFMIKVNFPVMPPTRREEKNAPAATEDSEWIEAQKDLYGTPEANVPDETAGRPSSYKDEQVELLKKELVGALKNAGNIRGLKPEEFVNIAVFGHASSGAGKGSVLTLRARKSDIDAFASGKVDDAAFKAKVTMTAYPGSGSGITSINSWIQESAGRLPLR